LVLWLIVMAVGSAAVVAMLVGVLAYRGNLSTPAYPDGPRRAQAAGIVPALGRGRLATFFFGTPTPTIAPSLSPEATAADSLGAAPTFTPASATVTPLPLPTSTATLTTAPTASRSPSTPLATFLPLPANVEGSPVPTVVPIDSSPASPETTPATSPPTRIVAPTIGLDAPVVPVGWHVEEQNGQKLAVWDVADYAAGWHKNSAYPGAVGNTVLSGHHNIKGEVFRYLVDLKVGDPIYLYAGDVRYDYVVRRTMIVKEKGEPREKRLENARWIAKSNDVRLTLVTCWPYTNNTHRVIIVALPK
jgi:sortase A